LAIEDARRITKVTKDTMETKKLTGIKNAEGKSQFK